jgi:hypothetical protein
LNKSSSPQEIPIPAKGQLLPPPPLQATSSLSEVPASPSPFTTLHKLIGKRALRSPTTILINKMNSLGSLNASNEDEKKNEKALYEEPVK